MLDQSDYIFCTLALGQKYCLLARKMANNISENAPGHKLVVLTDDPKAFSTFENVIPVPFKQKGILHCYHDKRFAIEYALTLSNTAVMIDVDAGFEGKIPNLNFQPGIECYSENLIEHVSKYTPERLDRLHAVAKKVGVDIHEASWIGESIFIVTRDEGKEQEFLHCWGKIGRYLEINKIHAGSGNAIGLAAAKVGWIPQKGDAFQCIKSLWNHFDASLQQTQPTTMDRWKRRLAFHYRLNAERVKALQYFDFYYR